MSYLKDREIWLSNVPTGNPPAGYFWKFIQNGKVVVRDSSGNNQIMVATSGSQAITGSLTVTGGITGTVSSASYVEYSNVANKPALVSGSSQVTYSGLTGIPSGIVSGSAQIASFGIFATTGSNGFNGSQSITGSLTVTGQVIAQTLNVQQVTSSIVYSSGSNVFGNSLANTQQFTGSVSVTGSFAVTTTGTELQVTSTGVNLGNALTDSHIISGSLRVNPNGLFVSGSGNVGIGTTNPEALSNNTTLQIDGTNHSFVRTGTSNYGGYFATIPTADVLCISNVRNPVTGTYSNTGKAASGINLFSESSNGYITFLTTSTNNSGPSERMRITSGGNVGIGTTSPTYRTEVALSISAYWNGTTFTGGNPTALSINNTTNGGYDSVLLLQQTDSGGTTKLAGGIGLVGTGPWTAGNNASQVSDMYFLVKNDSGGISERMRIKSSGNVGIGTTSPGYDGAGYGAIRYVSINNTSNTGTSLELANGSTANDAFISSLDFINTTNTGAAGAGRYGIASIRAFTTNASATNTGGGYLTFQTKADGGSGAERMRITSGGYLKATNNTYTNLAGGFHEINQSSNGSATIINTHSGTSDPYGIEVNFTGHDPNNASNYMFGAYTTSGGFTWIYRIFSNGTVSARSDARWKKNIETTRNGYIDDLCKLRVVKYNWYNHEDDTPKELGLIAQEVEEVFPNLVQHDPVISKREVEQEDGSFVEEEFEDGTSRSIKVSVLPYMLLKAIQEQQTLIESLKSRIEILEQ